MAFEIVDPRVGRGFLSNVILLSVREERRALRATCRSSERAGGAVLLKFIAMAPPNPRLWPCDPAQCAYYRLRFWSPWVCNHWIRRRGSLDVEHFRRCYGDVEKQKVHCCTNASMFYTIAGTRVPHPDEVPDAEHYHAIHFQCQYKVFNSKNEDFLLEGSYLPAIHVALTPMI
jgi:hypothetical protein